jgi:hypothetical protein
MKSVRCVFVSALALAAASNLASAQDPLMGRVYSFHSSAQAGCPALDWHLVTQGNGTLVGMISWDNMQNMAHATGTYNLQQKTFQLTAKEQGGQGRTAAVNGSIRSDGWLVANISGPNVNCQGINIPWYTPTGRPGGG